LIVNGGRQIDIGGVRVPIGVNVPKRKNELRRKHNQRDPRKLAMPPERHMGSPIQVLQYNVVPNCFVNAPSGWLRIWPVWCGNRPTVRHALEKELSPNT
jgi:hypothetical protein